MVTRGEVPHDERLPGSITVTVDEIRTNPAPRRDAELTARDEDGARGNYEQLFAEYSWLFDCPLLEIRTLVKAEVSEVLLLETLKRATFLDTK